MDAVFVANDQMAIGVLQVACKQGLHIPENLGVVGYDNITESAYFWPPLTTIQQDQFTIGKIAVEEVIKIIDANQAGEESIEPKSIMLSPTLITRQSSLRKKG